MELPKYLKKFEDSNGELEQWRAFLKEGKDMTQEQTSKWAKPEIEKAWEELEKLSKDPKLRLLYDSRMKQILDEQARHDTAIQEGLEKGLQQGLEQGLEKGLQQGLEQGLEKGLQQGLEQGLEQGL
ncbi:MAG TPA: hypothetical protein DCE42_11585, partial [Myxococcales bacterium]|nr:hypothetical protein [Myxococcales bacterium]